MRVKLLCALALLVSACSTGPKADIEQIQPRPIVKQQSEAIDIKAFMTKAKELHEIGNYAASVEIYQTILLHDNSNNEAWLGLGNSTFALGYTNDAYDAFLKVKVDSLTPYQKSDLLAGLTLLTVNTGTRIDQEANLKKAVKFVPEDPRLWNALGRYYDQKSMWVESAESYVRAMEIGGSQANIINNLGMSLTMQGRYSEAIKKFEQASATASKSILFDNNRRMVLTLQGKYNEATRGLTAERAAHLYNDAGYIAMKQGKGEQAFVLLSEAINVSPVYHVQAYANLKTLVGK